MSEVIKTPADVSIDSCEKEVGSQLRRTRFAFAQNPRTLIIHFLSIIQQYRPLYGVDGALLYLINLNTPGYV